MAGGKNSPKLMIRENGVNFNVWHVTVNHYYWHTLMEQKIQRIRLVSRCDKNNPIHLFLAQNVHIKQLSLHIEFGIAQKDAVSFFEGLVFNAATDFCEEWVGAIGEHQADCVRLSLAQRTRERIRTIIQRSHRF